jgi:GntR family transcriptional regulator
MDSPELLKRFSVEFDSGIPAYKQIINQVCSLVSGNVLREGDQLPTIRSLTDALGLNPNTVAKAFRELELKGVISSRRGCGSYIAPNSGVEVLSEEERRAKLDALYAKLLAEAGDLGISEDEVKEFINGRLGEWQWRS